MRWHDVRDVAIFFVLIVLLIGMVSCQYTSKTEKFDVNDITYFRDSRTGICFASVASNGGHMNNIVSITSVDCEKARPFLPLP